MPSRVLLGVTGSIAAIKAPLIARELMRAGFEVRVAMTEGAQQFTTATAMASITGAPVRTDVFAREAVGTGVWHVHLALSAEAMLIAPCSASMIARLRMGLYDDPVSLLAASLSPKTPLVIAPAMDEEMYFQSAVAENLQWLKSRGVKIIEPVSGALASGRSGMGRMSEPEDVVKAFQKSLKNKLSFGSSAPLSESALEDRRILITGGPTHEPIDPVRFIGNRSSGKMAAALAGAAERLGGDVTLIMGPSHVSTNGHFRRINIQTADELRNAVRDELPSADIIIMNAAVSDFAPEETSSKKLKKREIKEEDGSFSLKLRPTPDILSEIAREKRKDQIVVGFALETGESAEAYAVGKMEEKGLDMIVLNRADETGAGFNHDTNKVIIFTRAGAREELPLLTKEECADEIFMRILKIMNTKR